jgi:hypothetical protein
MSEPDHFLSRWSRRKRESEERADESAGPRADAEAQPPSAARGAAGEGESTERASAAPAEPPAVAPGAPVFDPASLPPIESIGPDTDIRAFLAPGVPPEFSRAALRRAWAADPKIRDFVGLADYDWDYHTPGSMAGFGPLEMTDDLRRMVARIIGDVAAEGRPEEIHDRAGDIKSVEKSPGDKSAGGALSSGPGDCGDSKAGMAQVTPEQKSAELPPRDELPQLRQGLIAAQHEPEDYRGDQSHASRGHGGALPK